MNTKPVATINHVAIQIVVNAGDKWIPVKPICEALGIDSEAQRQRVERDKILGSVAYIIKATGADGKQYEMFCIPYNIIGVRGEESRNRIIIV